MPWFPWEQIYGTVGYDPASDRAWGGEAPGRAGILRATDESYSEKKNPALACYHIQSACTTPASCSRDTVQNHPSLYTTMLLHKTCVLGESASKGD